MTGSSSPVRRVVETFTNIRGRMIAGPPFQDGEAMLVEPFAPQTISASRFFP